MSDNRIVFDYPDSNFLDPELPRGALSSSSFNTYRRCPRQFEYAYVIGLVSPPGISLVKGRAVHKGAETVHKHTIEHKTLLPLEAAQQAVSEQFDKEQAEIQDWEDTNPGKTKDNVINNFSIYYVQAVPLIKPVAAEKSFAKRFGTVPVRGVIDLIDSVPGEYTIGDDPSQPPPSVEVVSDLKTVEKTWSEHKLKHDIQLTFYSIVEDTPYVRVDLLLDQKKGCRYYPLRTLRDSQEKKLLIEDLEECASYIKKGIFPRCDPTVSTWACTPKFCGYYARCRGPK